MNRLNFSPEVRVAGHRLYQFVVAHVAEEVPITLTEVQQALDRMGLSDKDGVHAYRVAVAEAVYRCHDLPDGVDEVYAHSWLSINYSVDSVLCDAQMELMNKILREEPEY